MAAEIAIAGGEKIAGSITEVIIQQFKDIYYLEDNHGDLNENIKLMETKVSHVRTLFQNQRKVLEGHAQNCITKMEGEVEKAKKLSVRVEQWRSRCFDCWNLCYPKLATECRECKTNLVSLIKEINGEFKFLADVEQIVQAAPSEAKPVVLQHVPAGGFVGSFMESAQVELRTWLAESRHRVVGVWGMGGIGKTSLLKMIHNHFKEARDIFEDVIWVVVSQNFQVGELQKTIGKKVHLNFDESCDNDERRTELFDESCDNDERRTELSAYLEKKRFLIILDDMWEKIDLDKVGISFGKDKGSKVLISTRSEHVIAQMGAQECSLKMKALSEQEAWDLFKEKAFTNCQAALDKNIEAIAKKIALECKGLPLAVNAVGAAMVSRKTKDDWDRALPIMRSTDSSFKDIFCDIDKELYRPLRYSYDDLSYELKICFLYCAAFQEDAEIDAQRLVEILIAEGVLIGRETTYLMDLGYEYFHQLGNRCLIDWHVVPTSWTVKRSIKVHDVLRDMAIRIGKSEEHCLFATNQHLTNFPREKEVSNCKRISLAHNYIRDLPPDLMKCPNLFSLLLHSNHSLRHVPEPFLSSVMSLRVLDLSNTGITELPISVGELRLLEFLNLSSCIHLRELPESIGNLSALQFFNIDYCSKLKGLPSTIRGLKNLKHLTLDWCNNLKVNSDDIGQLTSLNRLVLNDDAPLRTGDVNNLTKMRALQAAVTAEDGGVGIIDTLTEIKQLTLSFQLDASEQGVTIKNIESVEILRLRWYKTASLPVCEFPNLKVLQLYECSEVRELPIQSFPMLEMLHLFRLQKLDSLLGISEGSMPNIRHLKIYCCPMLMKLPSRMTLPSLQVLDIRECVSIKELDIGNDDFPSLIYWSLIDLRGLERITSSNGVWNEDAISQLEEVTIMDCPLLRRISKRLIKLFKSDKMEWDGYVTGKNEDNSDNDEDGKDEDNIDNDEDESIVLEYWYDEQSSDCNVGWKDEDNIDNDEDESIALEYFPDEESSEDESIEQYIEDASIAPEISPLEEYSGALGPTSPPPPPPPFK